MKLVIDIPEKEYKAFMELIAVNISGRCSGKGIIQTCLNAVKNARPYVEFGAYIDGYLKALEGKEWIPTSEKLPKDGDSVLFCDIDDDIMVGYHVKGRPDTHFSQDGTYEEMKNVMAWMPLPKPYKGGDV